MKPMLPEALLSPGPGVRRRKDGSERAVCPSGRPSRPARIRRHPPKSGANGRFQRKTSRRSTPNPAVDAAQGPSPYLHPSGKTSLRPPHNTPGNGPPLDEDPLQPLDFNPLNPTLQHRHRPSLHQGDRNPPESVIGIVGTGDRNRWNRQSRGWRMYVHTVPFLNAAIQGLDQLYQIFRKPRRGDPAAPPRTDEQRAHIRKVIWSGACLAALSCVAWTFNGSTRARELAYQGETEYDKASWVTLYDVAGDADLRIPVPFQIGAAFIKLPEVALDLVAGRETLAGPKFVWSLVHGNLAVGWIPAVAQPIVEIRTNRNFFGDEIIPPYMANWPAERQYFDRSTPLPYRGVGAVLNVSPLHVQTIVRGWTGHLGNAVVVVLDEAMWNEQANGPKPFTKTVRLLTGVYSLQPPRPRTYTRFGNEFYAISDWAEGYAQSGACSGFGSAGWIPAVCRVRTLAGGTARAASELRRQGDSIGTDRYKTRHTKERELEALYAQIDEMFRLAVPELRGLRERGIELVQAPAAASRSSSIRQLRPQRPVRPRRPSRPRR